MKTIKDIVNNIIEFVKRPIIKNSLVYTITDALCKSMSFFLLPLVSYYVIPEELGISANFDVLQSILSLLAGQAVVNALPYFYYERSKQRMAGLVTSLFTIILIANIAFAGAILFIFGIVESYLQLSVGLQLLAVVYTIVQLLHSINAIIYRLEDKPYAFATIQLTESVIHIVFIIILVICCRMGALGKIYSSVGGYLLFAFINIYLLCKRGYFAKKPNFSSIKELLNFGIPLLPHSLSFWIKSGVDKILLTTYCGLAVNGLYSMAMSFGAIYTLCNNSFMMAFTPYLQKRLSLMTKGTENKEKRMIVSMIYKIYIFFVALYFVIVIFCKYIITYFLSEEYNESFSFIPWIMASLTIYAFYNLVIQFPYTVKKTGGLGVITFCGSILQLLLTFGSIQIWGQDGIKYSLVIGSLLIMLGVWWYSNKVYPLPWFNILKKDET